MPSTTARMASIVTDDTTDQSLEGFELDMDSGNLTLSFDEAVQISTFNLAGVALYPNSTSSDAFTVSSYYGQTASSKVSLSVALGLSKVKDVIFGLVVSGINVVAIDLLDGT